MKNDIEAMLKESADVKMKTIEISGDVEKAAKAVLECYRNGGKVILFGNGGSAAQAQHIAAEFINKFKIDRRPLPALALTTDTSNLTSISNDSTFDEVFEKQIMALCNSNDIVIAITTSDISEERHGHSANIYRGIMAAKQKNAKVIGMFSVKSKLAASLVDIPILIPSKETSRIQEAHITVMHIICELVENELFGD
ncbi:MAG: SIS domain-containing protein [Candidatus Aenigmatarchaeota archaeon]